MTVFKHFCRSVAFDALLLSHCQSALFLNISLIARDSLMTKTRSTGKSILVDWRTGQVHCRHLEPAMAFQLEINRMRNFELETIPTANRRMHLYLGRAFSQPSNDHPRTVVDHRFFLRCIIRHADLVCCRRD